MNGEKCNADRPVRANFVLEHSNPHYISQVLKIKPGLTDKV